MASNPNFLDQRGAYFLHEALSDALLYFRKKDYNHCISLLNEVGSYTDFDVNCRFYSGMCCYYKRNYSEAIKNFDACITDANNAFLPEAEYYKALSLYESGSTEKAVPLFRKIAEEEGFYSEKAKEFLK
jgi:tetratricopeptide (TPR) repeat protein